MADHDQRFKNLLKEFFGDFIRLFFPEWAERFDFTQVVWLDKEVFVDPPQGERRYLDLVARLPVRQPVAQPRGEPAESWIVLVHLEIEYEDKVAPLRPRMFTYYEQLRRLHQLPVLPIGLYLRVGLDGVGWDVYEEHFWERRLLRFEYAYVGLPALDAEPYATGDNLLGVALAALMRVPKERRAELRAEALQRVVESRENDNRRFMVVECIEAYWGLDEAQRRDFDQLLVSEKYQGVQQMMATTLEQVREQGLEEGIDKGRRRLLGRQLAVLFGPLSEQVLQRLADWPAGQLDELGEALLTAKSLRELGLED